MIIPINGIIFLTIHLIPFQNVAAIMMIAARVRVIVQSTAKCVEEAAQKNVSLLQRLFLNFLWPEMSSNLKKKSVLIYKGVFFSPQNGNVYNF